MKTIMPKPFERLSNGDKQAIYRAVSRLANEQIDKEEAEMQKNMVANGMHRFAQWLWIWEIKTFAIPRQLEAYV